MQSKHPFHDMTREAVRQRLTEIAHSGPCEADMAELEAHTATATALSRAVRMQADSTPAAFPSSALALLA